jgi:hypothetical protein
MGGPDGPWVALPGKCTEPLRCVTPSVTNRESRDIRGPTLAGTTPAARRLRGFVRTAANRRSRLLAPLGDRRRHRPEVSTAASSRLPPATTGAFAIAAAPGFIPTAIVASVPGRRSIGPSSTRPTDAAFVRPCRPEIAFVRAHPRPRCASFGAGRFVRGAGGRLPTGRWRRLHAAAASGIETVGVATARPILLNA